MEFSYIDSITAMANRVLGLVKRTCKDFKDITTLRTLYCSLVRPLLEYSCETGFANFINEWSQCDFCFTNLGVILEYLESSITTKKAIFRLSSTWSWHAYTIVRDTRSSCGGPLTWKAQIHDGGHRVNFDRNLPSGVEVAPCLLPKISGVEVTPSVTSAESSEQFWRICEPCVRPGILTHNAILID